MGNTDDNYTKFPNDILDAVIKGRFSAIQLTAIMYVVRKVNGWGKPSDRISITKMAHDSGYTRRAMIDAVGDLEKMGVLSVERHGGGRQSEMRINAPKHWDKPVNGGSHVNDGSLCTAVHRGVNSGSQEPVNSGSQEPVNGGSHTKEIKKVKDTYQKKGPSAPFSNNTDDDDEGWGFE